MLVKIDQIREKGLDLNEQLPQQKVQEALEASGFNAAAPVDLHFHLSKVGTGVLVKGDFSADLSAPCKRCITEVRLKVPARFTLNLVPKHLAEDLGVDDEEDDDEKAEVAGSFRLDDAEQDTFDGKVIDLGPIFREQLLLALPMYAVCDEACKGLCTVCGQNLNEGQCSCDTRQVDPRLAALKDIKLN